MIEKTGTVFRSVNNICTVKADETEKMFCCRIKGKVLEQARGEYNPLVVGDRVVFRAETEETREALITERLERKSVFSRWNSKAGMNQAICANADLAVCVCSVSDPPFRPYVIDRLIACCRNTDILICINKTDLISGESGSGTVPEMVDIYGKLGFRVLQVSAKTGKNIEELKNYLRGKTAVTVGQSGVGKSSLVNCLCGKNPENGQKTGETNRKYNSGNHTTSCSVMIECPAFRLIDTPGFRDIQVPSGDALEVQTSFPEFSGFGCAFAGCLHIEEPGCRVRKAVLDGLISTQRYRSYVSIAGAVKERLKERLKEPVRKRSK